MLLALVTEEASPFFRHFSILELGPFNRDATIELLRRPSTRLPPAISSSILDPDNAKRGREVRLDASASRGVRKWLILYSAAAAENPSLRQLPISPSVGLAERPCPRGARRKKAALAAHPRPRFRPSCSADRRNAGLHRDPPRR